MKKRDMNKKTFTVAVVFLCLAVIWLGINILWFRSSHRAGDMVIPVLFVVAGIGMVWNEFRKKRRQHVEDVKKYL